MSKLWIIERDVADWTDEDVAAVGLRAKMCVLWYPNMEWVRSFLDRDSDRLLCIYRAETEEDVRKHAEAAGLPFGTVIPVDEVLPADLDEPTEGDVAEHAFTFGPPPLPVTDPA